MLYPDAAKIDLRRDNTCFRDQTSKREEMPYLACNDKKAF